MIWHPFNVTTVTPAFLGQDSVGITEPTRVPFPVSSLRGVLRYWLRALVGEHVGENRVQLATIEAKVFGTAPGGAIKGGPSPVRLRARGPVRYRPASPKPDWLETESGYLLGQGLYDEDHDVLRRPYIEPGTSVHLEVANAAGADCAELFLAALWALEAFGGLGARARRGFGTVAVEPPSGLTAQVSGGWSPTAAADIEFVCADIRARVRGAIKSLGLLPSEPSPPGPRRPVPEPPRPRPPARPAGGVLFPPRPPSYPCFRDDWFDLADEKLTGGSMAAALAETGKILRSARRGDADSSSSQEYETIVRPYLDGGMPGREPFLLAAFGLPVVFSDQPPGATRRRSATVEPIIGGKPARRASPLWLRVHRDDVGEWWLRSLIFHAELLPGRPELRIKARGQEPEEITTPTPDMVKQRLIRSWFDEDGESSE